MVIDFRADRNFKSLSGSVSVSNLCFVKPSDLEV